MIFNDSTENSNNPSERIFDGIIDSVGIDSEGAYASFLQLVFIHGERVGEDEIKPPDLETEDKIPKVPRNASRKFKET